VPWEATLSKPRVVRCGGLSIISKVEQRLPQTLRIEARGEDVANLQSTAGATANDVVPDPVERWVSAVNAGLLGGASEKPSRCAAALVATRADPSRQLQTWDVQIQAVDWGAFAVLLNLLRARNFAEIALRSVQLAERAERELDFSSLGLPELPRQLPFPCELPDPEDSPELSAQISFANASEQVVDQAVSVLDAWAELILLGGYAALGQNPQNSGALPRGAILYDASTVAQSFEGAFFADLRAFNAVVCYAVKLVEQGIPVTAVVIR
jgi:hypothetical protein